MNTENHLKNKELQEFMGAVLAEKLLIAIILFFLTATTSIAQIFNGNFLYQGDGATLTLQLQQQGTQVTGTLKSSTGTVFNIQGKVSENTSMGTCVNQDGGSYYEAYIEGGNLTFGLISTDANNMPDYSTAQYIVFNLVSSSVPSDNQTRVNAGPNNNTTNKSSTPTGSSGITGNEIGDAAWGFKLSPPTSWTSQKSESAIILGHNTIAGMILIFPHTASSLDAMHVEMKDGIQEDGSYLILSDQQIMNAGNNILKANYQGMMNGENVKANGYGVLSPYGGGAYILAISTPDKLSRELVGAAEQVINNIRFFKQEVSEMSKFFAGKWTTMTKSTQTDIYFYADGTYQQQYESSYSGEGGWGHAQNSADRGKWSISGNRQSGQIRVILNNGNELIYNYSANTQSGNEYYLNNSLYFRNN